MLTVEMKRIIQGLKLGFVATVNPDCTPHISPAETFVVLNDSTLAFGEIRSPNTVRNIASHPQVAVNFFDVLARKAVRVRGTADYHRQNSDTFTRWYPQFEAWGPVARVIRGIVLIELTTAELVFSPAYDLGQSETELKVHWRNHLLSM